MANYYLIKKFENGIVTIKDSRDNSLQTIPFDDWHSFEAKAKVEARQIIFEFGLKTKIELYNPELDWIVELPVGSKQFKAIPKQNLSTWQVRERVPGAVWDSVKGGYKIPLTEGWRLAEVIVQANQTVRYSDEAQKAITKQIEQRTEIDKIAIAKDWDYPVSLGGGVQLRKFQKVSAAFVEATEFKTLLALEMGLGKTIVSLAIAIKNGFKTIIICPASLKANWCREIYKLSGKKPVVFSGRDPLPIDVITMLKGENQFFVINYDILSSRAKYIETKVINGEKHEIPQDRSMWAEAINMGAFDLAIFDESHYIKNSDSNRSIATRRITVPRIIHMTGTPVLNRPGELWPILTSIRPDLFPSEDLFLQQYTYNGKVAKNVEDLKKTLKNVMLRRKQTDVIDDIPPLNRIEDYHELSSKALKIYNKVLEGIYESVAEYSAKSEKKELLVTRILTQIMRCKQVCAIDKVDSTAELAFELHESAIEHKHNKVLIFSQFKAVAFAIAQKLGHEALCFVERGNKDFITVGMEERDRLVQQFQNDPKIKYLVVTEKTAKEGHNITQAGFVIFNDLFWTPAAHEQGEGRAYMRQNDPHGITSYYRITDMDNDGIEEWIWDLLKKKMAIINATVEGVEGSRDVSVAMELISKIKDNMYVKRRH